MTVTKEVKEFITTHTKSETYLYNNRLFFSKIISSEQYNINHAFIKSERSLSMND